MERDVLLRWIKTCVVLLAMMNAGINVGIFSPTLPDMAILTSSSTAAISTTLIWTGLASMAGAIIFGPLFDKYDGMSVLAVALFMQGISLGLTPWCPELIGFQIFAALASFFNLGIMAGSISVNCVIWQKQPDMISPIVQVTDLLHALGTAITPQIMEPFLEMHDHGNSSSALPNIANLSSSNGSLTMNEGMISTVLPKVERPHGVQRVQLAYVLIAVFDVLVAAICLVMYIVGRGSIESRLMSYEYEKHRMIRRRSYSLNEDGTRLLEAEEETKPVPRNRTGTGNLANVVLKKNFENRVLRDESGNSTLRKLLEERRKQRLEAEESQKKASDTSMSAHGQETDSSIPELSFNRLMISLLIVIIVFFTLNGGRDALFTGLLFTYLDSLGWNTRTGTMMVTMYHVTRVVVHIAVVFIAKCVSPAKLTLGNQIIVVAASGFMLATVRSSPVFLAIGIILTGFATSNLNATAITLAQTSFRVSGKTMGLLFAGGGCGVIIFSPIAGFLLQSVGPASFSAILLAISCAASVLFAVWIVLGRIVRRNYVNDQIEHVIIDDAMEKFPLLSK